MQDEKHYQRIEHEFDPERCKSTITIGSNQKQCNFKRVQGSDYCQIHGGNKVTESIEKNNLKMYRLTKWQARLAEFSSSSELKSLTNEIGILRICLEEMLNQCNSATILICYSDKISSLATNIEKLVNSCHKLDLSLGQYLDQTQAINLVETIITIINSNNHIAGADKESLASDISEKCLKLIKENSKATSLKVMEPNA
jgi:hypothetical protein